MTAKSGNLKSRSIVFIDDGVDLYSSRCMSDPNFMALALTSTEKQGYMQNLIKSKSVKCKDAYD